MVFIFLCWFIKSTPENYAIFFRCEVHLRAALPVDLRGGIEMTAIKKSAPLRRDGLYSAIPP
jgi:hypothetical protein